MFLWSSGRLASGLLEEPAVGVQYFELGYRVTRGGRRHEMWKLQDRFSTTIAAEECGGSDGLGPV